MHPLILTSLLGLGGRYTTESRRSAGYAGPPARGRLLPTIMLSRHFRRFLPAATLVLLLAGVSFGQNTTTRISLDQAIDLALVHNHSIKATRTLIFQNQAQEITANLRPNPTLGADSQFVPFFSPQDFSGTNLDQTQQFDVGLSYLFERGRKRQHRLQAAQDQTAVTRSQVADNERALTFTVGQQFINVELAESTLELAAEDLKSFQNTVDISESRYKAGDISEDDLLKIKLQMLQFQTDLSQAKLLRVQGLSDLRQLLGYESVPADYDVAGQFDYQQIKGNVEDFQAKALQTRPDLRAAQQG